MSRRGEKVEGTVVRREKRCDEAENPQLCCQAFTIELLPFISRGKTHLNSLNQLIGTLMKKRMLLISSSLIDMGKNTKDGGVWRLIRCSDVKVTWIFSKLPLLSVISLLRT